MTTTDQDRVAGRLRTSPRWVPPLTAALAVALLPWIMLLPFTLPTSAEARNWSLMWMGLDVLQSLGLAGTSLLARRHDPRLAPVASATSALLMLDAWCDVTTSAPGSALVQAVVLALVVELPVAALCGWLALQRHI